MYKTGIANPAELAMLTRVMETMSTEMGIEKGSPRYSALASHLMILFEATKDEARLLTLMRRSRDRLHVRPMRSRRSEALL